MPRKTVAMDVGRHRVCEILETKQELVRVASNTRQNVYPDSKKSEDEDRVGLNGQLLPFASIWLLWFGVVGTKARLVQSASNRLGRPTRAGFAQPPLPASWKEVIAAH